MPTVQEILKQSGLNDEQIAAVDAKVMAGVTGVLTAAEQAQHTAQEAAAKANADLLATQQAQEKADKERQAAVQEKEAAETIKRANEQYYAESIVPALNTWGTEKANLEAEIAFYRKQNETARNSGFIAAEAPKFTPPEASFSEAQVRDNKGRYAANVPGATPGSPTFTMEDVRNGLGSTLGTLTDIQWKYQTLFGKPMPISPTELVRQAEAVKLDPATYAARTFQFTEKETEIARRAQEEHDAKIRAEAVAPFEAKLAEKDKAVDEAIKANDRKWAEKIGSNPDVRIAETSRFADVTRAVKAGERADPLSMNDSQRKIATRQAIRSEIVENAA
jgi:hypothetical protein